MATRADYVREATVAYDKYVAVQQRIENIEQRVQIKYPNSGLAANRLKSGEEYWLYRDLCTDRTRYMAIAQLNASMAAIV